VWWANLLQNTVNQRASAACPSPLPVQNTDDFYRGGGMSASQLNGVKAAYAAGDVAWVQVWVVGTEQYYVSGGNRAPAILHHNVPPGAQLPYDPHVGWVSSCDPAAPPGTPGDCAPTVPPLPYGLSISTVVTTSNQVTHQRWLKDFRHAEPPEPLGPFTDKDQWRYVHREPLPESFVIPPGFTAADVIDLEVHITIGQQTVYAECGQNFPGITANSATFDMNPAFENHLAWCP
jgi:hypothetical protein